MRAFALFFVLSSLVTTQAPPPTPSSQTPPGISPPAITGIPHNCSNFYPPLAQRLNEEGTTRLGFTITKQGTVSNVRVVDSSGHEDLDAAAVLCVNTWRYFPAIQSGTPVESPWQADVKFAMEEFDPAIQNLFLAGYACTQNPPLDSDEKASVRRPTVLQIRFANGMVAGVLVAATSGNEKLDTRAATCFASLSPDLVKQIANIPLLIIPVVWKND